MSKHHPHDNGQKAETTPEAESSETNQTVNPDQTGAGTESPAGMDQPDSVSAEPERPEKQDAEQPEPLTAEEKIAGLEENLKEANNQYLRKAADFENFRKRMNREKQDAIEFANQCLLLDLIPVIDDFDRAIKSAETMASTSKEFDSFYEGITLIEKRLVTQLENKWGLKRFDSAGEAFDPNRHEAIMMEKSPETPEPVVQEDFLKGYTLKDRVIRSAKVKVLMPEEAPRQEI
jgi:molecular chaperone GrpE